MSNTIDERVVEMRFDNRQFESNARESMGTLEKLKQALNMSEETDSFEDLEKVANKIDMSGLGDAIESVKSKFSALEVMAVTALTNITNRAVDAGIQLVQSLSTDQITAGWDKYAQKTSSVQTIMAATAKDFEDTGEQMEYVNEQLEKLNWFTDETSYNFLDMVNNIGKFTSNNIPLEQSVTAMQGISTWAAISGANVQEAGRAMYNLSQAIAVGAVKLMDWKSIENANMATAEFKQTAIDTAVSMGTLIQVSDGLYKTMKGNEVSISNFNDALSDAWFTSDVLLSTLNKYGSFTDTLYDMMEAMESETITTSRVLQALEKYKEGTLDIIDFSEECGISVSKLTEYMDILSDETMKLGERSFRAAQEAKTFQEAIDATKDAVSTGWMNTFETIFGNYQEAKVLWTDLANFLYDIFALPLETQNEILSGWKELGGRDDLFDGIKAAWAALMSVIEPVKEAWDYIFPPKGTDERTKGLVDLTKKFKEFMESLKISEDSADKLKRTFQGLFAIVDIVKQVFSAFYRLLSPAVSKIFSLSGGILTVTATIGDWIVALDEAIKENEWLIKGVDNIQKAFNIAKEKIVDFVNVIKEWVNMHFPTPDVSFITDFADKIEIRFEPLKGLFNFIGKVINLVATAMIKVAPIFATAARTIGNVLSSLGKRIQEAFTNGGFRALIDIFNASAIASMVTKVSTFVKTLSSIKESLDIFDSISKIKDAILDTFGALQAQLKSNVLKNLAVSIAILSASILVLSLIDSEKLKESLNAIKTLFTTLFTSMTIFEKLMEKSGITAMTKINGSLMALSASVLILAIAIKNIAGIDPVQLATSISAVTALLAELTLIAITLSKYGGKINTGSVSIIAFSTAILILTQSVKQLGQLDPEEISKGLLALLGILSELTLFMIGSKFGEFKASQAMSILILSASLLILQKAVAAFAKLNLDEMAKGLGSVGAILAEIGLFSILTSKSKNITQVAISTTILASALALLTIPMEKFGNMSWDQISRGLVAMGAALTEIALAMKFMPKNVAATGFGLIEVAGALAIIGAALNNLGDMSWDQISRGLVAMGAALTELAVALNFMKGTLGAATAVLVASIALLTLIPVLKVLGSMSWGDIAKALVSIAGVFIIIGAAGTILSSVVPSILGLSAAIALLGVGTLAVGAGLLAFSAGLSALAIAGTAAATTIVAMLEILIVGLLNLIADSADSLGNALKTIISVLCDAILSSVPEIVEVVLTVTKEILSSLVDNIPDIVHLIIELIVKIINAVTEDIPSIVSSIANFVKVLISSIINEIGKIDTKQFLEGLGAMGLLTIIAIELASLAPILPAAMAGVLGLAAIVAELTLVLAAIGGLSYIPGLNDIISSGGNFLQELGAAIGKFIGGIIGGIAAGVTSQLPQVGTNLSGFMTNIQPFIDGAKSINPDTMKGVMALSEVILVLTASSILDGLTSWFTGGTSLTKFGEELADFGPHFMKYYETVKDVDGSVVEASANAALTLAEMASKLPGQDGVIQWFTGSQTLSDFAIELKKFGPKLKEYADSVEGLDSDIVVASANAALALAEMANKLPPQNGVAQWFTGSQTLTNFAEELAAFGPLLSEYSKSVEGLDPDVVIASANAALALANLANNLPAKDGVAQWFTGTQSLSVFAEELSLFGPLLASYAKSVEGLNPDVVVASANAALSLSNLASNLPPQNGVAQWFTGTQSLSVFAEEIAKFGPYFAKYAKDVEGVKPEVVTASANAAKALSELEKNLPSQGGVAQWFTGSQDIGVFGEQLSKFGTAMSRYYYSVSEINTDKLSVVIQEVQKLVSIAKSIETLNFSGMSSFANNLKDMGNKGITEFINGFTNSNTKIQNAVNTMIGYVSSAITNSKSNIEKSAKTVGEVVSEAVIAGITNNESEIRNSAIMIVTVITNTLDDSLTDKTFKIMGSTAIQRLIDGIDSMKSIAKSSSTIICIAITDIIKEKLNDSVMYAIGMNAIRSLSNGMASTEFYVTNGAIVICEAAVSTMQETMSDKIMNDIGKTAMTATANGIKSNSYTVTDAIKATAYSATNTLKDNLTYSEFYNYGTNITSSLSSGIRSGINDVKSAATSIAKSAIEAAKNTLGIHSPSTIFTDMGTNLPNAMGGGMLRNISAVADASYNLAEVAINPIQKAIELISESIEDADSDYNPTITPVIDFSNVSEGADRVASMFKGLDLSTTIGLVDSASSGFSRNRRSSLDKTLDDKKVEDKLDQLIKDTNEKPRTENVNTFYIQSTDPKQAAEEVGYIMQHKVERGKAAWAK